MPSASASGLQVTIAMEAVLTLGTMVLTVRGASGRATGLLPPSLESGGTHPDVDHWYGCHALQTGDQLKQEGLLNGGLLSR